MQSLRIFMASLGAFACLACSASDTAPTRQTTSALAGGTIDPDTTAVFALEISAPEPALCSAVLVAPNVLLTARHGLAVNPVTDVVCGETPLDTLVEPALVRLGNVLSYLDAPRPGARLPGIARFEVPPGTADICGNDLAAILLDQNVAIAPLALRLTEFPKTGERYTAVGYGTSTVSEGSRAGVRMRLEEQVVRCLGDACSIPTAATEFGGDDGVCHGDSGGPAIDPLGRVFGIASRSAEGCKTPVYTSLAAFAEWLEPLLNEAAALGGYERPPTDSPPEPEPPAEEPSSTTTSHEVRSAELGERCDAERACAATLACVYENAPEEARCRERCREDSDCPAAQACDSEALVCWEPPSSGEPDCALGGAPARPSGIGLFAIAAGVTAVAGVRRQRRRERA